MNRTVIVIGGGIAGLTAARELADRGMAVTLLEAKTRFGGRIHTLKHGKPPIELGAEFIHGRSPTLLRAIREAGLSAIRVPLQQKRLEHGRMQRADVWQVMDDVLRRVDPRQPDCSFEAFLRREKFDARTKQIARGFAEGFNAAYAGRISTHSLLKAEFSAGRMHGDWQGRVDEGYSALVQYLARQTARAGGRLLTGARVKELRWRSGHVEVKSQTGRKIHTAHADAAVLTLPLGVWKAGKVRIRPTLPAKQEAVREMEFGNVLKPILVFKHQWWPRKAGGFFQSPSEALPTWWNDPRGPVLTGWVGGSRADELRSLSPRGLEALCLEILGRLFSERPANLRRHLTAIYHHRWERDPDILGSYSYLPVNGLELPRELAAPVADTLFFAGEATTLDAQMGTVFGALDSGLRVAREVRTALER